RVLQRSGHARVHPGAVHSPGADGPGPGRHLPATGRGLRPGDRGRRGRALSGQHAPPLGAGHRSPRRAGANPAPRGCPRSVPAAAWPVLLLRRPVHRGPGCTVLPLPRTPTRSGVAAGRRRGVVTGSSTDDGGPPVATESAGRASRALALLLATALVGALCLFAHRNLPYSGFWFDEAVQFWISL